MERPTTTYNHLQPPQKHLQPLANHRKPSGTRHKCLKYGKTTTCHVHEMQESNETSTSPWNLTLPGPMYNQPSHEMKCESMLIIFYIPPVVSSLSLLHFRIFSANGKELIKHEIPLATKQLSQSHISWTHQNISLSRRTFEFWKAHKN